MFRGLFSLILLFSLPSFAAHGVTVPQKFLDQQMTRPVNDQSIMTYVKAGKAGASAALKASEWRACQQKKSQMLSVGDRAQSIAAFIENRNVIFNIQDMETKSLRQGQVTVSPWSGDYWPYASGLIAARYMDSEFILEESWRKKLTYVQAHPMSRVIAEQGQAGVETLSPAEKYDLLTGSANADLTMSMWQQGVNYEDENGDVDTWMGICHGWAAAAIMESRPSQEVQLKSLDGKWNLSLLPSEIKSLVSYSWAHNSFSSLSLGSRCNQKEPIRDSVGRIVDTRCQDMNPGTWHQVVINLVGDQKRSFVMDATYDFEVWNQPVKAYSYNYFNLNTESPSENIQDSLLKVSDIKNDKFAAYRAPGTVYVIGVEMKLAYVSETRANRDKVDIEENDSIIWLSYRYDLELDAKLNIIGGEWYSEAHPDFVWNPIKNSRPVSSYDKALGTTTWDTQAELLPLNWAKWGQVASEQGQVIHRIIESIVDRSSSK